MKTIEISEDIYNMLRELQETNESMDDVIGKLLDQYYDDVNNGKLNQEVEEEFDDEIYY
ncbi:MAG: antitoxin VapB family protein [Methanosphaera sp.]